jgi:hypothetical protein
MKSNAFILSLCKKLAEVGKNVSVVGDYFDYPGIKNYQNLPRTSVLKLLDKSKCTITSDENFFSLFTLDCLSCGLKIYFNSKKYKKIFFFKDSFFGINYDNLTSSFQIIMSKKKYKKNYTLNNFKFIYQQKKILFQIRKEKCYD